MSVKLLSYAFNTLYQEVLRAYGIWVNRCFNAPSIVSFAITERCNARCVSCDLWNNSSGEELPKEVWMETLTQLQALTPKCAINFTGGEPFVRKDFCEILTYANQLGFYTTVITNGMGFDRQLCDRVIRTGLDYLNISVNSMDKNVHDHSKGVCGLHEKIISAVKYIKSTNKKIKICFSCVISKDNYKQLNDYAQWALNIGVDIIDYIPILSSFGHNVRNDGPVLATASNPMLQLDDLDRLDRELDQLAEKRKAGFPIVTPTHYLTRLKDYYRNPDSVRPKPVCRIGLRNMYLLPGGDVKLCYFYPPIGNVRKKMIRDIWFDDITQKQRELLISCKRPCMCSALREYNLGDMFKILSARI